MEINLVWRTDVHLSDRGPSSRTDDWTEAVFANLDQVRALAEQVRAAAILDGGDFFHVKSPGQNSHALVHRTAEHHDGYPCPVYCTPGNHDAVYGDYSFLPQQPLGVLFTTGVFKRLYDEHEVYFAKRSDEMCAKAYPYNAKSGWVSGNPFAIEKGRREGPIVRVVAVPYHGTKYDMDRFTRIEKGDEDILICVAHVLASLKGGTMFEGEDIIKYADLVDTAPDVYCFLPGTKVLDRNGCPVSIEDIATSQEIMGREGAVKVEAVHPVRHVDEDIVIFDVEGVPSDLIPGVTCEHPFWVARNLSCRLPSRSARRCHPDKVRTSHPCRTCHESPEVSPEWCGAGEVRAGDYVSLPYPKIPSGAVSEPGLARLLGYYVAEGHIIENRRKEPVAGVGWSFHAEEHDLHEDVGSLVRQHFGLEVKPHSMVPYGSQCVQVCVYGPEVARFCLENGGRHAPAKSLSAWVWDLDADSRIQILLGWMLGDGHARVSKTEVMGGTSSPTLASQVFLMALSVGLRPYYTIRPAGEVTFPNGHTSPTLPHHIISFYGGDAEMLSRLMGVDPPERSKTKVAGFFHSGLFWRRVREVSRQHYRGPVYNMRTSTEEYVAGHLLTHNCFGHWHKDQGVEELGGNQFVNVGSLTRGSLSQDEVQRIPASAVLRCTDAGVKVEVHRLSVPPAEEVFDVEGRARQIKRQVEMDTFVTSLRDALQPKDGSKSLSDEVSGLGDVPHEVRERALSYLEQA